MRHRLFFPGHRILRAAASGVVMVTAAAAGLGPPLAGSRPPVSLAASAAAAQPAGSVTVPLVTGNQVTVAPTGAGRSSYALRPAAGGGAAALGYDSGGDHYVIPAAAMPYAGRQLDRSLFDVSALARDGITGSARVPVSLAFAAGVTPAAPPGVTLTSVSGQQAQGYLTAGSAPAFAAALRRQIGADVAAGHQPGTAPLFGGLATMDLAAAGAPITVQPYYPLHILQVNVTDDTGTSATFDQLVLVNNDDHTRMFVREPVVGGVARIAVPAGHYTALVAFEGLDSSGNTTEWRIVTRDDLVVPATAGVTTTASIDEVSAASAVSVATPRPATQDSLNLLYYPVDATGSGAVITLAIYGDSVPVYVNAQAAPSAGRLDYVVEWGGAGPAASAGYRYDVAFRNEGVPADERFVVRPDQVAVMRHHFSADPAAGTGTGYFENGPIDADTQLTGGGLTVGVVTMPGNLTEYVGTADSDQSFQLLSTNSGLFLSADARTFTARHQYSVQWAHGPLAPDPGQHTGPTNCLACLAGGTLFLFLPVGDSEPDHGGIFGGGLNSHLTVYRDGTPVFDGSGQAPALAQGLPATPATFRVVYDTDLTGVQGISQSVRTHTDLTMPYIPADAGSALPAEDSCQGQSASTPCQILPALTLGYNLATDESNTSSAPLQVLRLRVGHLSYDGAGSHAAITSAAVSVSFDGGAIWQSAAMAGSAGQFTATWPNPASARGTDPEIKVTAADASGGSITQTITSAYTIAAPAN